MTGRGQKNAGPLAALMVFALFLGVFTGSPQGAVHSCEDGLDNDGDGWIDHEDSVFNENALAPSCDNNGDLTE